MRGLFLLLLLAPIAELWFIIVVGSAIGALAAIALLFVAGVAGLALWRGQSLATLTRVQSRLDQGQEAPQELAEGFLLTLGGALLLFPGFLSDILALLLITPPLRQLWARWLLRKGGAWQVNGGNFRFTSFTFRGGPTRRGDFFEGEFTREGEPPGHLPPHRPPHDDI
ncbi:MAG: FxsA family protein [Pseudomonadales bacterium]|jgi:UPF0716 protein FxsA|nr:FxsA family protein [Pseudomonadales bacterium]